MQPHDHGRIGDLGGEQTVGATFRAFDQIEADPAIELAQHVPAIVQRLGVAPQPVSLIQLKRAQLRELVRALIGEKVFYRADRPALPLAWNGLDLPGVSEHLTEAPPPPPLPKRSNMLTVDRHGLPSALAERLTDEVRASFAETPREGRFKFLAQALGLDDLRHQPRSVDALSTRALAREQEFLGIAAVHDLEAHDRNDRRGDADADLTEGEAGIR